jgi:hypothetical protein
MITEGVRSSESAIASSLALKAGVHRMVIRDSRTPLAFGFGPVFFAIAIAIVNISPPVMRAATYATQSNRSFAKYRPVLGL